MDIEVRIRGLMMDPATNMPIVVLKDVASETVMPIWVGIFEANAIAIEIEKVSWSRPMTHDLTRNLIRDLNAELERVVITELKDDTFLAVLWLRMPLRWRCARIVRFTSPSR
jgi:bifunctional DNase/RNase